MAELTGRQALEAAIAELDRQIEALRTTRQALADVLGGVVPGIPHAGNSSSPATDTPKPLGGDPLAHVREQEFHGFSKAEAARVFLKRTGAQKTPTILAALVKGGLAQESKAPEAALYTSLARHSAFVSLKKNWWDLAERRPDLAEEQRERKRRLTRKPHRGKGRSRRQKHSAAQAEQRPEETRASLLDMGEE